LSEGAGPLLRRRKGTACLHWAWFEAAVKLTTHAFAELKADRKIGRAEAFRRSMLELTQKSTLVDAHPSMWAPFVVVGEGGL
jgi:CHAT domain-containing protein